MPNLNGTGPQGIGPNGRKMGVCQSSIERGCFSRGQGCGFGRPHLFWSNHLSKDQEKTMLEQELQIIKDRLKELEETE